MASDSSTLDELWRADPFAAFYNQDGLADVILTADVDWAPEFAIREVIEHVGERGHKITIFATHESEILADPPDFVEVGVHPDFTMRHNQISFDEAFTRLKGWYPDAVGTRAHCNFFGDNIAELATKHGLIYDASVFEWNVPLCQAYVDRYGLARFPYFWEDGIHLDMELPLSWDEVKLSTPGLKVLNVHPILIYMNCETDEVRRRFVRNYKDLTQVSREEIDPFVRAGRGIRDLWIELLDWLKAGRVRTHHLRDAAREGIARAAASDS